MKPVLVPALSALLMLSAACNDSSREGPAARASNEATPTATETAPVPPPAVPSAAPAEAKEKRPEIVCEPGKVVFHQPGLEEEVRYKLKKPEGAISAAELASIKSINLTKVDVDYLDPCIFPKLKGMRDLFLGKGELDSLAVLQPLTQLVSLRASINKVSDLKPLTYLKKLDRLDLGRTLVRDLAPLAELENLTELELDGTEIESVAPLASCSKLERVSIKGTRVKDVAPLAGLKNLKSVDVSGSPVENAFALYPLKSRGLKLIE